MTDFAALAPALLGFGNGLALIVAIGAQNAFLLRVGIEAQRRVVVSVVVFCIVSDAILITAGLLGVGALLEVAPAALTVMRYAGAVFLLAYAAFAARRAWRPARAGLVPSTTEPLLDGGTADDAVGDGRHGRGPVATGAALGEVTGPGAPSGTGGASPTTGTVTLDRPLVGTPARTAGTPRVGALTTRAALLTVAALTWLNPHAYLDTVVLLGSIGNQQGPDDRWTWLGGVLTASVVWFTTVGFGARLLRPVFARPAAWRVLDGFVAVVMTVLGVKLLLGH